MFFSKLEEIDQILFLSLKKFARGFSYQRGVIFGFGDTANYDTSSILKISALNAEELSKLDDKVPVHNIGEERSVGIQL